MSDLAERIKNLSSNTHLTDWERGFCESISQSLEKWGNLTPKQHNLLQKIEGNYTEEKLKDIKEWKENFTPEMRRRCEIAANYYANHAGYYRGLASRFLTEPDFVPSYQEYKKLCENDYALGVIENALSEPKFAVGTLVTARASHPNRYRVKNKLLLVVQHSMNVSSHAKGAKPVAVLPIGEAEMMWTEERFLKLPKKKKN